MEHLKISVKPETEQDRANQGVTQQGQGESITHQVRMFKLMLTPECRDRFEQIHAEQSVANEALRLVNDWTSMNSMSFASMILLKISSKMCQTVTTNRKDV